MLFAAVKILIANFNNIVEVNMLTIACLFNTFYLMSSKTNHWKNKKQKRSTKMKSYGIIQIQKQKKSTGWSQHIFCSSYSCQEKCKHSTNEQK